MIASDQDADDRDRRSLQADRDRSPSLEPPSLMAALWQSAQPGRGTPRPRVTYDARRDASAEPSSRCSCSPAPPSSACGGDDGGRRGRRRPPRLRAQRDLGGAEASDVRQRLRPAHHRGGRRGRRDRRSRTASAPPARRSPAATSVDVRLAVGRRGRTQPTRRRSRSTSNAGAADSVRERRLRGPSTGIGDEAFSDSFAERVGLRRRDGSFFAQWYDFGTVDDEENLPQEQGPRALRSPTSCERCRLAVSARP